MALAYDNSAQSTYLNNSGQTFSYTVGAGTKRILIVGIAVVGVQTVTSITYAGTSLTFINSISNAGTALRLYYLINPTSGANNLVWTLSSGVSNQAFLISYSGASQSAQPDASSTGGPTNTTNYSQSVTTIADNCFQVLFASGVFGTPTGGTNTTVRQDNTGTNGLFLVDSTAAKTPAGTATLAVSTASAFNYIGAMVSIAPDPLQNLTLTAALGTFTLTGIAANLIRGRSLTLNTGNYIVTGPDISLRLKAWTKIQKNTASWTTGNRDASSWNNITKS